MKGSNLVRVNCAQILIPLCPKSVMPTCAHTPIEPVGEVTRRCVLGGDVAPLFPKLVEGHVLPYVHLPMKQNARLMTISLEKETTMRPLLSPVEFKRRARAARHDSLGLNFDPEATVALTTLARRQFLGAFKRWAHLVLGGICPGWGCSRDMGKELAPRVFDQRVALSDAKKRAKKELKGGGKGDLKAVVDVRYPVHSTRGAYKVVMTGIIVEGKIFAAFGYDRAGRVKKEDLSPEAKATEEWPACLPDHEKPGAKLVCSYCKAEVKDGENGTLYAKENGAEAFCCACEETTFFTDIICVENDWEDLT